MTPEQIKAAILKITGATADEYAQEVYDSGLVFASHYMRHDDWGISAITGTKSYWAWWQNQLALLDEVFITGFPLQGLGVATQPPSPKGERTDSPSGVRGSYARRELKALWKQRHQPVYVCAIPNLHNEYSLMFDRATVEDSFHAKTVKP